MKRNIMIVIGALVLVIGAYFALTHFGAQEEQPVSPQPDGAISIYSVDASQIASVTIETPEFSYTLRQENGSWVPDGLVNVELKQDQVQSLISKLAAIYATGQIDAQGSLSQFGLEPPVGTPKITLTDGTEVGFAVGGKVPTGDGYYFKTADSGQVYTIATERGDAFLAPLETYRERTLIPFPTENIKEFKLKRADTEIVLQDWDNKPIDNNYAMSKWRMVSPYRRNAALEVLSEQIMSALAFHVQDFVDDNPSSYTPYGLDHPSYQISITKDGQEPVTIQLGSQTEDGFYARVAGRPNVYTISKSSLPYLDIQPVSIVDPMAFIPNVETVDGIRFTADGQTHTMEIRRQGEETSYFINGKGTSKEAFTQTYQTLVSSTISGIANDAEKGGLICSLEVDYNHGSENDTIAFYEYGDRYAAMSVNGRVDFYVMRDQVSTMVNSVNSLAQQ